MNIPYATIEPFEPFGIPHITMPNGMVSELEINFALYDAFCKEDESIINKSKNEDSKPIVAQWMRQILIDAGVSAGAAQVRVRSIALRNRHTIYGFTYVIDFWIHGVSQPYTRELEQHFN